MARGTIITDTLKDGAKRYRTVIRVEHDGQRKQVWKTFDRKKDAEDYLDRTSPDVRDQTYREIKKATFGQYIKHWKETYLIPQKLKPFTIHGYGSILDAHLVPKFGHCAMQAIESAEITAFEARLLQSGKSSTTVRNILTVLGRIFRDARKEHYLKISPMQDMDKTKVTKTKKGRALKPDEIRSLLAECAGMLRIVVLTAGLRRSEIFALHWTDDKGDARSYVDFENDVIRVRQAICFLHGRQLKPKTAGAASWVFTAPKSKQSIRDVPLSPALKKELLAHYLRAADKHGLVFQTANGTPVDPNNVCRYNPEPKTPVDSRYQQPRVYFPDAVRQAGIGPLRFHDLRHTYGSMKIDQGENIYDVQRWMGHSSIQVTIDIYGHPLTDRGPEAAAKTDAMLFGMPTEAPGRRPSRPPIDRFLNIRKGPGNRPFFVGGLASSPELLENC